MKAGERRGLFRLHALVWLQTLCVPSTTPVAVGLLFFSFLIPHLSREEASLEILRSQGILGSRLVLAPQRFLDLLPGRIDPGPLSSPAGFRFLGMTGTTVVEEGLSRIGVGCSCNPCQASQQSSLWTTGIVVLMHSEGVRLGFAPPRQGLLR